MGWNSLDTIQGDLFPASLKGAYVYFVHSYYVPVGDDSAAITTYGIPFSAAMQKDNFFATQFHPEKSGDPGQQILSNFLQL
jgi:glutamine amidotransferase